MKTVLLILSVVFGVTRGALAAPLVTAFERFHSQDASVEGGRLLFNELGCVNCHDLKTGLPQRSGPQIAGATLRINAKWLSEFLSDPGGAHQGSGMPQMLHGYEAADIESVVQYLGSLKPKSSAKPKASKHANARRGGELFHSVGLHAE
jgi:cytochrome c2